MYGLAKAYKIAKDGLPYFRPFSAIVTPTWKLPKLWVPMLEPLRSPGA